MLKWFKTLIALLFLPVCVGAAEALGRVVRASGQADTIWVAAVSGAACWLVIYLLLPKPMWVYVFGHELVFAVFGVGRSFSNWQPYVVWFHLLLGAAYAFHVTLTWHILKTSQSDITDQGYLFSAVVIFLGNAVVLLVGIPLLTARVDVLTALRWWGSDTAAAVLWLAKLCRI